MLEANNTLSRRGDRKIFRLDSDFRFRESQLEFEWSLLFSYFVDLKSCS